MSHEFHRRSYFDCDWNLHAFFRTSKGRRAIAYLSRLDRWATLHHDRDDFGGFWRCGIDRELAFLIGPASRQPNTCRSGRFPSEKNFFYFKLTRAPRLGRGSVWIYVLNSALAASREWLHISRMAHLAQKILRKVIHAAAVVALFTGVASAQSLMPGLNLSADKPPLTPQEEEKRKATEDSYKSALKKIPDKQKSVDPWENIRPNPSTSPKTKQGQQ